MYCTVVMSAYTQDVAISADVTIVTVYAVVSASMTLAYTTALHFH